MVCKLWLYCSNNSNIGCFILTKWYVNVIAASSSAVNGSCFILTKWYVNSFISGRKERT